MKASELLVKALEQEGVEYIFGIPGEENLDFLESIRSSTIQFILTRHEQGAGFIAATFGRLTGKPGVCLATLGPGATNLVTPTAFAQLGRMPLIIITGQKPILKSKQGLFQILDVVGMMEPLTKFSKQIVSGNTIPALVREAFRLTVEERPGVVHLELPEDIAREEVSETNPFPVHPAPVYIAGKENIKQALEALLQATSPLILIGANSNQENTVKALRQFITTVQIPFFDTQMGKGVMDEKHPLYLGTAALSDNDYIHCAIKHADLILNVGHDMVEKPPFLMEHDDKTVIHLNYFSAQVDEVYFPQIEVVGDIANSLEQLTTELQSHIEEQLTTKWDFTYFNRVRNQLHSQIAKIAQDNRYPILPQHLVALIENIFPADGVLTLDNGIYKLWFARNYKCQLPKTLLLDNALASMGAGLPAAIAAKLVHPTRKVMAICGDGGFLMSGQELETAVRLQLDLVILLLNDNAFGMIRWKQEGMGFPDYSLTYNNPDFIKYADSFGAKGYRVNSSEELSMLIVECLNRPGVHLIEVAIDYSQNHQLLTVDIKDIDCNF